MLPKCPEVRKASQGRTIEETVKNLKEATELYLEEFPLKIKDKTFITTFCGNRIICGFFIGLAAKVPTFLLGLRLNNLT